MPRLNLPPEFLSLQLTFATRMTQLTGESLEYGLIEYTNMRTLLNLRVTHEDAHEVEGWQSYLRGLREASDPHDWTFEYYRRSEEGEPEPDDGGGFGCFYYSYPFRDEPKVRLHFRNVDRTSYGALSRQRMPARRAELAALVAEVCRDHPEAQTIRGGSWLYNIEPYRRLFPPEYIASAEPVGFELQFWSLWGQFLRGGGRLDADASRRFLSAVAASQTPAQCVRSFPYEVLRPECDVEHFRRFFSGRAAGN